MAKPIEQAGPVVVASMPLRLRSYHPSRLPDASECAGSIIVVNDSGVSDPPRLALAEGGRWRLLAYADEIKAPAAQTVDVTPLVRDAVRALLPALPAPVPVPALPAPVADDDEFRKAMAQAVLTLTETVNDQQRRIAYLEQHALKDSDRVQAEFIPRAG